MLHCERNAGEHKFKRRVRVVVAGQLRLGGPAERGKLRATAELPASVLS